MDMTIEKKPIKREVLNKSCATHTAGLSYSCYMHITSISHVPYICRLCVHARTHTCTYICMYQAHHTHMMYTRSIKGK